MIERIFREKEIYCSIPYTLIELKNCACQTLVVQRAKPPYAGRWNFLGGKIESGESPKRSAIRELAEEAGIKRSERTVRFCGVALWPTSADMLIGMYLFKAAIRSKKAAYEQLTIDGEGVYSWLDLGRESQQDAFVPNAKILQDTFMHGSESKPIILVHEVLETGECKYKKLRPTSRFQELCKREYEEHIIDLNDIAQVKSLSEFEIFG